MKIVGFNHFQLDSMDVDRTRAFYEALGGLLTQTMERKGGWKGYHVLLAPGCTIEIQPPRFADMCGGWNGWDHLALNVENCQAAVDALLAAGGTVEKMPTPNKIGDTQIINAVTRGLDNEKIEFIQTVGAEDNGGFKIFGVNHLKLNADDFEGVKDFYVKGVDGARVTATLYGKDGNVNGYMVEIAPQTVIEICPPRFPCDGKNSAWNTIAVTIEEINSAIEGWKAVGGIHEVGPFTGSMGTIAIKNSVEIGPAGEHFEFIELI